tara:strand:+ start:301 stop:453 length:153 start_codon:yes stop_codon:yes gene_type:complete
MTRREKSIAIERKEILDDYYNHFLSHFGFYDEKKNNNSQYWKYYKPDQTI